ncbi:MAG TPA: ROK family protein [Opitutaceae bacterium]|nr:ROK family protein [Opitutaceae bacterium]
MSAPVFGIDIGGTKTAVSLLAPTRGARTRVRELHRFATGGPRETLEAAAAVIAQHVTGAPPLCGIACGGPLDAARGLVLSPPNLPGWDRVRVNDFFVRRFGRGTRAALMNDANASALAEWRFGAGRGCRSMVFLTAGTGMGGGIILNGQLVEGACGNGGEVGHLRLAPRGPVGFRKPGSFEGFCSGGGVAQLARFLPRADRPGNLRAWMRTHPSARAIAAAARKGDRTARAVFAESGRKLGAALALLIDTLNPERIVLGSLWLRCRDLLEPTMRETLVAESLPDSLRACRIVAARLGEQIGNYGAVCAALHALDRSGPRRRARGDYTADSP